MVQILLIRPGSTDYDQQRRIQGNLDVPLNEQGTAEVRRMIDDLRARHLAPEAVYASKCEPAWQTAAAVAQAIDAKLRELDGMENVDHGLWQGMLIDDVRLKQPRVYRQWQEQPETVCPPEGEMLGEADERVQAGLARLLKRHKDGLVALVAPEPLASLARRQLDHGELGDLWKAVAEQPGRWQLLEVNPETVLL